MRSHTVISANILEQDAQSHSALHMETNVGDAAKTTTLRWSADPHEDEWVNWWAKKTQDEMHKEDKASMVRWEEHDQNLIW